MKLKIALSVLFVLACGLLVAVSAQESNNAAQQAHELRMQLMDLQNREAELKVRLEQLNYDLKPENIERQFNGFGSTRPEEQRELRRRQLQAEKDLVANQLEQLSVARSRLEAAISEADSRAYQQSALGSSSSALQPKRPLRFFLGSRIVMTGVIGLMVILGLVLYVAYRKRNSATAQP